MARQQPTIKPKINKICQVITAAERKAEAAWHKWDMHTYNMENQKAEKFKALEAGDSVSDELAKMKAMLPGGDAEVKGALPASEIDDELSKLKSEIAAEGGGAAASEESAPPSKPAA